MQKESLRTRGLGGRYSRYFAGGFALRRCRNSIRRYSTAPKREFRSQFPLFPSIVKYYLQFAPVCSSLLQFVLFTPSLKNCRESMGSNMGHGFSGHPDRFPGSRRVTANCEQQPMAARTLTLIERFIQLGPSLVALTALYMAYV